MQTVAGSYTEFENTLIFWYDDVNGSSHIETAKII